MDVQAFYTQIEYIVKTCNEIDTLCFTSHRTWLDESILPKQCEFWDQDGPSHMRCGLVTTHFGFCLVEDAR